MMAQEQDLEGVVKRMPQLPVSNLFCCDVLRWCDVSELHGKSILCNVGDIRDHTAFTQQCGLGIVSQDRKK
jgi:hypothetical protein